MSTGIILGYSIIRHLSHKRTHISGIRAASGTIIPSGILVDIIDAKTGQSGEPCKMNEAQDFGEILKSQKRAVLFAVPGAFTPTCSAQHLPGFISKSSELRSNGVEDIYCLSVNDRFVMRSWAQSTPGCIESGIKMVADGNGEFSKALELSKDATGSRMGIRSKRFAAIVENGKIVSLHVDEKGLEKSSAENILLSLKDINA